MSGELRPKKQPIDGVKIVRCPKCKGSGKTRKRFSSEYIKRLFIKETCDYCRGLGQMDWLESMTGKKEDPDIHKWRFTDDPGPY